MDGGGLALIAGVVLLPYGGLQYRYAYHFARFGEMIDAIGSKRTADEVEPTDWNVDLTRIVGMMIAFVGVVLLVSGLQTTLVG